MSTEWNAKSVDEKKPFSELADVDKARYIKQMTEYKAKVKK